MNFQNRVYKAVKKIPRGRVASYSQVARAMGKPKMARAVGNALNRNRDPKVFCHHVVKSDGSIGGYAWGQKKKIAILRREGIKIKDGKIEDKYFFKIR